MVMTSRSSTSCCTCTAGRRRGGGSRSYGASLGPDPAAFFNAPPCLSPIQKKVGSAGPSRRGAPIEARLDGSPELTFNARTPHAGIEHTLTESYTAPSNPRIQEQVHG